MPNSLKNNTWDYLFHARVKKVRKRSQESQEIVAGRGVASEQAKPRGSHASFLSVMVSENRSLVPVNGKKATVESKLDDGSWDEGEGTEYWQQRADPELWPHSDAMTAFCAPDGVIYRVVPDPDVGFSVDWWVEEVGRWRPISCDTTPEGAVEEMMLLAKMPRERTP
jgi:hypothetical protein